MSQRLRKKRNLRCGIKSNVVVSLKRIQADKHDLPWHLTVFTYPTIMLFPADECVKTSPPCCSLISAIFSSLSARKNSSIVFPSSAEAITSVHLIRFLLYHLYVDHSSQSSWCPRPTNNSFLTMLSSSYVDFSQLSLIVKSLWSMLCENKTPSIHSVSFRMEIFAVATCCGCCREAMEKCSGLRSLENRKTRKNVAMTYPSQCRRSRAIRSSVFAGSSSFLSCCVFFFSLSLFFFFILRTTLHWANVVTRMLRRKEEGDGERECIWLEIGRRRRRRILAFATVYIYINTPTMTVSKSRNEMPYLT